MGKDEEMPRPKRTPDEIRQMRERILDATIDLLEENGIGTTQFTDF